MSWRERAQPVQATASDWRSRAQPIQAAPAAPTPSVDARAMFQQALSKQTIEGGKRVTEAAKTVGGFAKDVAVDVATNPAKTIGEAVGGVGGAALGGTYAAIGEGDPASIAAGAVLGSGVGATALGYAGNKIDDAVKSALGFKPRDYNVGSELAVNTAIPVAGVVAKPVARAVFGETVSALSKSLMSTAEQGIKDSGIKVGKTDVLSAARRVYGKDADKLLMASEATAGVVQPEGIKAAQKTLGQAGGYFQDKSVVPNIEARVKARNTYTKPAITFDVRKATENIVNKMDAAKATLQKEERDAALRIYGGNKSEATTVTFKTLSDALTSDAVATPMLNSGLKDVYNNLLSSLPTQQASRKVMTKGQFGQFMANLETQLNRKDTNFRQTFYNDVWPSLKSAFEQPAFAKGYPEGQEVINQFERRFAFHDLSKEFPEYLRKSDYQNALRVATQDKESFKYAQEAFNRVGNKQGFTALLQNAADTAIRDTGGNVTISKLSGVLSQLDTPTGRAAVGDQHVEKLKDLYAVELATEVAGFERSMRQILKGEVPTKDSEELGKYVLSTVGVGLVTGNANSLQKGQMTAKTGNYVIDLLRNLSFKAAGISDFKNASVDGFLKGVASKQPSQELYKQYVAAASALGNPVVDATRFNAELDRFNALVDELNKSVGADNGMSVGETLNAPASESPQQSPSSDTFKQIEDELRGGDTGGYDPMAELTGQGGPEETAPSMSQDERDYNVLMSDSENDTLGQLITSIEEQNKLHAMMDDNDLFVREQLKEDTKVLSKLSTKHEEGFRSRVYKDTVGKRTVGIGFNMDSDGARKRWEAAGIKTSFDDVLAGRKTITQQEAETLYQNDKKTFSTAASKLVKNYTTLGKHQQAALIDMVYQLGPTGAMSFARTRSLIEAGKYSEAAKAMLASANYKQTPNRVLRRAYMLEHNVSLAQADAALVKSGKISAKESTQNPADLKKAISELETAPAVAQAAPAAPVQVAAAPVKKKRPTYAQAKANKGIA